MVTHTFRLPEDILDQAKLKAGLIPLGRIVRILVFKWLRGEIQIKPEDDTEEEN